MKKAFLNGWTFQDVPGWLRQQIAAEYEIEALCWCMGKDIRQGKATDSEICAGLMLAGLASPIEHNAAEIYIHLAAKLTEARGMPVPEDLRNTVLTRDQERELEEMRREIYRRRGRAETELTRALKDVFGKPQRSKKCNIEPISSELPVTPEKEISSPPTQTVEYLLKNSVQSILPFVEENSWIYSAAVV